MNTYTPTTGRGILYICVAAIAWGTGGAAAAVLFTVSGLGPLAVSFWRFAGGVLLLLAVHLVVHRRTPDLPRTRWRQVIVTGVGLAVYQTAYFAAVGYAGLAVATVVTLGCGPILIAIGSHLLVGEPLGRGGAVIVTMALAGLFLLVGGGGLDTGSAPLLGLLCALLSATGYAGVTLLGRKRGRDGGSGNSPAMTLGGFAVGLLCLFPLAVIEGPLPSAGDIGQVLGLLVYLGIVPTALAYRLFFAGLATVRATTASVVALVEPVTAAVIAVVLLHEQLTVATVAGSAIMLGAVVALTVGERRETGGRIYGGAGPRADLRRYREPTTAARLARPANTATGPPGPSTGRTAGTTGPRNTSA
ncbi:DMT family transporter [Micromonospora sp. NPDC049891]|uniref:DMT family transporter n=1 Tax=Micromonospora sp. NPDC049891 TaxID=3155655 RepID=UPI0033F0C928